MIDPEDFLNQSVEGATSDKYVPIDATAEGYECMVSKLEPKIIRVRKDDTLRALLEVYWQITGPEAELKAQMEATGRDECIVRQTIFLDADIAEGDSEDEHRITAIHSGTGVNVPLGQLRSAIGQNDPKKKWNFGMLVGSMARVKVEHDPQDDGNVYARVPKNGVTRL